MTTLLTSIALVAGVAQAQEQPLPDQGTRYAVECTDTQVNMFVSVTPMDGAGPSSVLYQDGAVLETNCFGGLADARRNFLQASLHDQCTFSGLSDSLCSDLSNDIADAVQSLATEPPLTGIGVITQDDALPSRARFRLGYDDMSVERWRGLLQEDGGWLTRRRTSGQFDPDTRLDCIASAVRFGHGRLTDIARLEMRDELSWRCTDDMRQLDIEVSFAFKNRAVGELLSDGMPQ